MSAMTMQELFSEVELTPAIVERAVMRREMLRTTDGPDAVEVCEIEMTSILKELSEAAAERALTSEECERLRATMVQWRATRETPMSTWDRSWWSDVMTSGRRAVAREAKQKRRAQEKPKTPRELEKRLHAMGFSRQESKTLVACGWNGTLPKKLDPE